MAHPYELDSDSTNNGPTMQHSTTNTCTTSLPTHPMSDSYGDNHDTTRQTTDADDDDDARTTKSTDDERIHDFPLPFLVRTKTNQEKDQMRSEYHQQQQRRQSSMTQPQQKQQQQQQPQPQATTSVSPEQSKRYPAVFGWVYKGYKTLSTSILLENKASVARDHLANERTFLAWLRTSLSLITVGVAITQLYHLNPSSSNKLQVGRALGATFVALSIVFLYFANARYFHSQYALTQGQFPASRGAVLLGSICVLAVLLAMFIVIVTERP